MKTLKRILMGLIGIVTGFAIHIAASLNFTQTINASSIPPPEQTAILSPL